MRQLLCSILECWYLDISFFESLIAEFNIDLDYDEIIQEFWKTNINIFIYEAYEQVKNMFIEQNFEEIQKITEKDAYEVDYEIFLNYCDSHLWFNNQEVEALFQKWRDEIKS
ncbi:MAG: hypothetical protein ACD_49C00064G0024 [uncultured bacterium (gcode 4)]|uniref:Uncharacterized protein n=1 Tax=uncultured bacterium (gcode 4) TaxID=1234023 RepID=K2AWQ4_9BACT|nr:MAG: hypothetical protein ACD_49C00064G0024 [uncultured bacterium (gcode 4)]